MKSLSLKQPFAELILQGKKTIELRKWNTNFRGEFLIHASKTPDKDSMDKFNFKDDELPLGAIVGKAELINVKKYSSETEFKADKDKHLADISWGKYGFILKNSVRFNKPIAAKGKLNFWDFDILNSS